MATKAQIAEFTAIAKRGYLNQEFIGLYTSAMHAAFCIGRHLAETGRTAPHDVWPGRGDLIHANGMLWRLNWTSIKHPTISRES
jgi:hypothetical protein